MLVARPLRVLYPGAVYHAYARGNEQRPIFWCDDDFRRFLELLELGIDRHGWLCHSYCLMTNHYHLLVETPRANLPQGMRHLNGCYTQDFNRRYGRVGHLFQGRYAAILVEKGQHSLNVVRYIARNPVRAGMCTRPQDWPWSSYGALIGERSAPPWLTSTWVLGQLGGTLDESRRRLRSLVENGDDDELRIRGVLLGSDQFVEDHASRLREDPEIPRSHWQPVRPSLDALFTARGDGISVAYRVWGYTMHEIADHLGCHYSTVSRRLRRSELANEDRAA